MWSPRWIRDLLAPLAGVGIEVYEAVWADPPVWGVILAGLGMIWGPIDAVTGLIGRQLGQPAPSPPSPPNTQEASGARS